MVEQRWQSRGNCVGMTTEMFSLQGGSGATLRVRLHRKRAKLICVGCPVWDECSEESINNYTAYEEGDPIMAGRTFIERFAIWRERNPRQKKVQAA